MVTKAVNTITFMARACSGCAVELSEPRKTNVKRFEGSRPMKFSALKQASGAFNYLHAANSRALASAGDGLEPGALEPGDRVRDSTPAGDRPVGAGGSRFQLSGCARLHPAVPARKPRLAFPLSGSSF